MTNFESKELIYFNKELSVIIPVMEEAENIPILAKQIEEAFKGRQEKWECIWIDDGSKDNSWSVICKLPFPHKGLRLKTNVGQSNALMAGIDASRYEILGTLDGDLQNDPQDLVKMLDLLTDNLDYIQGFREVRRDLFFSRRLPSLVANWLARKLSGYSIKDLGCSTRIVRKSQFGSLRVMGEMHRVIGLYLLDSGASHLEVPVNHRNRTLGVSKYGIGRTFKFIADIILYKSMKTLLNKPIYLFLKSSLVGISLGLLMILLSILLRVTGIKDYFDASLIIGGISVITTSIVIIGLGLVAELIARLLIRNDLGLQYQIKERFEA
jgi:glycosyltransferase involved in cell wall biosynthesis